MKIIALRDSSGMGKTTSIDLAANKFIQEATRLGYAPVVSRNNTIVVQIPECKLVVVFGPAGDSGDTVEDNIKKGLTNNADILVTASRTKGEPADVICRYGQANSNDEVLWISPVTRKWTPAGPLHNAPKYTALNNLTAIHILEVLKYVISHIRPNCQVLQSDVSDIGGRE